MTGRSAFVLDVTARDGFQIVKDWIPTELKKEILDGIVAAGVRQLETSSFVSPKAVPQMADAAEVTRYVRERYPEVTAAVLAPNMRGVENAVAAGAIDVNYVISASEEHNKVNIRRTHEESLADLGTIMAAFPRVLVNVGLATAFGCPFSGAVPVGTVLTLIGRVMELGVKSVTLADTIGVANPLQVRHVLRTVERAYPGLDLRLHMHDTHGMGLANMAAALNEGISVFETAAGGMGGCPFAPGAAGNTATEDAVNMLHRMGVDTGIDLDKYLLVVERIRETIGVPLPGRFAKARTFKEFCFFDPRDAA